MGAAAMAAVSLGLLVLGGCGASRAAPSAGESTGMVPDLSGRTVMVFPVQSVQGLQAEAEAEMVFALQSREAGIDWVMPAELRAAAVSSPSLDVRLEALPVGVFLRAEVERVGDPLYGYVRRLAGLTGADAALIPVALRYRPSAPDRPGAAEVVAALVDVRTGYVLWFGVEDGEPGGAGELAVVASAMEALARRLAPR